MKIYVRSPDGTTTTLPYNPLSLVGDVKTRLRQLNPRIRAEDRLFYQGANLSEGRSIQDYGIGAASILQVVSVGPQGPFAPATRRVAIQKNPNEIYWLNYQGIEDWTTQQLTSVASQDRCLSLLFRGQFITAPQRLREFESHLAADPNLIFVIVPSEKFWFYSQLPAEPIVNYE